MTLGKVVKRLRLGDDVPAYCGRCKDERTHQIVAFNAAGGVERVTCSTCGGQHLYRERSAEAAKAAPRAARRQQNGSNAAAAASRVVVPYSPQDAYQQGQLISHTKFGTGEVLEARAGKISVRFDGEVRTLLHAG